MKTKISLLLSGNLGYQVLLDVIKYCDIEFIATDKNSVEIINFSQQNKIPIFIGNPRSGKLKDFIKNFSCTILLSINYLFLIEEDVISKFKYPINFHGSLLPKYRGRTPHVWAIINNEIETGITAHFIDNGCDTGDVILQEKIPLSNKDTGFSILEKFTQVYPILVKKIINLYRSDKILGKKQQHEKATFYGKRTPDDGLIYWNWQKERINNWVRALSFPYPGAFTFYKDEKIIIDKISYSTVGFNNSIPNGTILLVEPKPVIKTSNGAIVLEIIRNNNKIEFVENKILT